MSAHYYYKEYKKANDLDFLCIIELKHHMTWCREIKLTIELLIIIQFIQINLS